MIFSFKKTSQKGFTLLELLISLSIFAVMSAVLLAKYGTFNQGVLLTNLAYDIALTIRNAQSYGLNVKSADRATNDFNNAFGVHFDTTSVDTAKRFVFFIDENNDGVYNDCEPGDLGYPNCKTDQVSTIKRGSRISQICIYSDCSVVTTLDITFKRPDPSAIIKSNGITVPYAEIFIKSNSDDSVKKVIVNSTGQISVK